jgi:type I restriction enzyme S subunit
LQPQNGTDAEFIRRRIMMGDFLEFTAGLDKGDRPRVDYRQVAEFTIELPSLPEQRRIVAKLDSPRAREELGRIPRLIQTYREAILSAAFGGELTRGWRAARALPDARPVNLGSVAYEFSYGSAAKSSPTGEVPVLRMGNIQDGSLNWGDLVFTSNKDEIAKYDLRAGDVLFNRTNSPALVGKTALYRGERPAIYAGYLIRIRCSPALMPAFLTYYLNSPAGRDYCWRVKTDGVSQSNINAKKLAAFQLPLPTVKEQQEIVRRIETAFAWLDRVAASTPKHRGSCPNSTRASWPRPSVANWCRPIVSPVSWPPLNRRRHRPAERLPYQLQFLTRK